MSGYLKFLWRNRRLLALGALLAAASSFGQTWFVALFSADLRATFGLSHGEFGSIYSAATLASGVCLVWVGRLIDRLDLRIYCVTAFLAMAGGAFALSRIESVAALGFTLFALRISGQGMLSHASVTTMARFFDAGRGKALSVAALGNPFAESSLPAAAVAGAAVLGWRDTWSGAAALLALVVLPGAIGLLGNPSRIEVWEETVGTTRRGRAEFARRDWTRGQVLRDSAFYLMLPALLASPFIATGIMFHQVYLFEEKGWGLGWLATCYVGYATAKVAGNLASGPLVDRVTAVRLFPLVHPVHALGLFVLGGSGSPFAGLAYFSLSGFTTGFNGPVGGAYWAERYGIAHLGAIRSLAAAIMVLGSALSPAIYGWLIDDGTTMGAIAVWSAVYVLAAAGLSARACWRTEARADLQSE